MPTRRTPMNRLYRNNKITPRVVELFQRMQAARDNCTCPEPEADALVLATPRALHRL